MKHNKRIFPWRVGLLLIFALALFAGCSSPTTTASLYTTDEGAGELAVEFLAAYQDEDLATMAELASPELAPQFLEIDGLGESHERYQQFFSGAEWEATSELDGEPLEIRYLQDDTGTWAYVNFGAYGSQYVIVQLIWLNDQWYAEFITLVPQTTFEQVSPVNPVWTPVEALPDTGITRTNINEVALGFLTAFKERDLLTMAVFVPWDMQQEMRQIAAWGEDNLYYQQGFSGPEWDAIKKWDGQSIEARYYGRTAQIASAAVKFGEFKDDANNQKVMVVQMTWMNNQWYATGFSAITPENFDSGDTIVPVDPSNPESNSAE